MSQRPSFRPHKSLSVPSAASTATKALVGWNDRAESYDWNAILRGPDELPAPMPARQGQECIDTAFQRIADLADSLYKRLSAGETDTLCAELENVMDQVDGALRESSNNTDVRTVCIECIHTLGSALGESSLTPLEQQTWILRLDLLDTEFYLDCGQFMMHDIDAQGGDWIGLGREIERRMRELGPLTHGETQSSLNRRQRLFAWLCECDLYGIADDEDDDVPSDFIPRMMANHEALGCTLGFANDLLVEGLDARSAHAVCIPAAHRLAGHSDALDDAFRDLLARIAAHEHHARLACSYRMESFLGAPSLMTATALFRTAEEAGICPEACAAAASFLASGFRNPLAGLLPPIEIEPLQARLPNASSCLEGLVHLSLRCNSTDDLARFHAAWRKDDDYEASYTDQLVADRLAKSHPHAAIAIANRLLEQLPTPIYTQYPSEVRNPVGTLRSSYEALDDKAGWEAHVRTLSARKTNLRRILNPAKDPLF